MATSVTSAGLKAAADKVIIASRPVVEVLKLFATNFDVKPAVKGDGVAVEVLSATASDFGSQNGYTVSTNGIKPATVALNQHKKSTYTIGDTDALENEFAPVWANLAPTAGKAVAKEAVAYAMSLLTYDKAKAQLTKNPSTLGDWSDIRALVVAQDLDPADCVLALIPEYFAKLIALVPANTLGSDEAIRMARLGEFLGFKAVIEAPNASNVSGAAVSGVSPTNGIGYVIPTGALCIAGRVVQPVKAGGNLIEFGTIQDEETGFAFGTRVVVDADQGTCSWSVDALFGAALSYKTGDGGYNNGAPRFLQIKKA